jgi:hypothetical protein
MTSISDVDLHAMLIISTYIALSGQVLFICGIAGIPIIAGLHWYAHYLRVLLYVSRHHRGDLLARGVSPAKMVYAHLLFSTGLVACILTILFRIALLWDVILFFFTFPLPLYLSAQQSIWNYRTRFWSKSDVNFGDDNLIKIRRGLRDANTMFLNLFLAQAGISLIITLFGIILRYVQMVVQHQ